MHSTCTRSMHCAEGDCAIVHSIVDKKAHRRQKHACWTQNGNIAAQISTEVRRHSRSLLACAAAATWPHTALFACRGCAWCRDIHIGDVARLPSPLLLPGSPWMEVLQLRGAPCQATRKQAAPDPLVLGTRCRAAIQQSMTAA